MHDTLTMGLVEAVRELDARSESPVEWERAPAKHLRERFALDVLHDKKIDAVFAADVVERANMRMVQTRDRARFALEPFTPSWI